MGALNRKPLPDAAELRQFGLIMGSFIALVFGLVLPWLFGRAWPLWPWALAAVFVVWALAAPGSLSLVYRGWMRFGAIMGRITTPLLMVTVFVIVIVPAALLMRLLRRDPLARSLDSAADSYRVASVRPPRENLHKPF